MLSSGALESMATASWQWPTLFLGSNLAVGRCTLLEFLRLLERGRDVPFQLLLVHRSLEEQLGLCAVVELFEDLRHFLLDLLLHDFLGERLLFMLQVLGAIGRDAADAFEDDFAF